MQKKEKKNRACVCISNTIRSLCRLKCLCLLGAANPYFSRAPVGHRLMVNWKFPYEFSEKKKKIKNKITASFRKTSSALSYNWPPKKGLSKFHFENANWNRRRLTQADIKIMLFRRLFSIFFRLFIVLTRLGRRMGPSPEPAPPKSVGIVRGAKAFATRHPRQKCVALWTRKYPITNPCMRCRYVSLNIFTTFQGLWMGFSCWFTSVSFNKYYMKLCWECVFDQIK